MPDIKHLIQLYHTKNKQRTKTLGTLSINDKILYHTKNKQRTKTRNNT